MVSQAAAKYFPEGTRITAGRGYLLWVELPKKVDAVKLFRAAVAAHITIVRAHLFHHGTVSQLHPHQLRIPLVGCH